MNKQILKSIRDNMPEPLKYITAPIFRNKLIKNKTFCLYYEMLCERDKLNEKEIKEYQLLQLKEILKYSYSFVPYYTSLFDRIGFRPANVKSFKDIEVIPFLTKELIRANFDQLISTEKVSGGYYAATTGGSTGEPLKVLLDYDSIYKENAFIYSYRKCLDYKLEDKLATFRGLEFGDKLWKYNPMHKELVFSPFKLSSQTLQKYVDKVEQFKPAYIHGYLSSVYHFAVLLSNQGITLNLSLKGILLISENINPEQREFIEKYFKVPSATFYGHSERCVIAPEKEKNKYSFDPYYGYTELVPTENELSEIVSTGFLNKTMPLIRYKTNDICQNNLDGLVSIQGRWNVDDFLVGAKSEKVFHSAFNFHSEIFKNVSNYQFVQKEKGKADLRLLVNSDFQKSELEQMKKEIDKKTKGIIDFNIEIVDKMILSGRGKFKMFISNVE